MNKPISCWFLHHGIQFEVDSLRHCCFNNITHNGNRTGRPLIIEKENIMLETLIDDISKSKNELFHKLNNNIDCECTNCYKLERGDWQEINSQNLKLTHLIFSYDHNCNCNCYYCTQNHKLRCGYDFTTILDTLNKTVIDFDNIKFVNWVGGEPTLFTNFDELFTKFSLNNNSQFCSVPTSAVKYNELISKRLNKKEYIHIIISLDSGTVETYRKIKNVDQFNNVVENIVKYYQNTTDKSRIKIKYIMLPENCSELEIDSFIELIKSRNLIECTLLVDVNFDDTNISKEVLAGVYYLQIRALKELGKNVFPNTIIGQKIPTYIEKLHIYNLNSTSNNKSNSHHTISESEAFSVIKRGFKSKIAKNKILYEFSKSLWYFTKAMYRLYKYYMLKYKN